MCSTLTVCVGEGLMGRMGVCGGLWKKEERERRVESFNSSFGGLIEVLAVSARDEAL